MLPISALLADKRKRIKFALPGSQNDTVVCLAADRVTGNERNFSISSDAELFSTRGEEVVWLLLKQCFHQVFRINCSDRKHDKRFGGDLLAADDVE